MWDYICLLYYVYNHYSGNISSTFVIKTQRSLYQEQSTSVDYTDSFKELFTWFHKNVICTIKTKYLACKIIFDTVSWYNVQTSLSFSSFDEKMHHHGCRLLRSSRWPWMISWTAEGSSSVLRSPNPSKSRSTTFRSTRRIILPERVFGRRWTNCENDQIMTKRLKYKFVLNVCV